MKSKLKIAAVSYTNTKPFLYGLGKKSIGQSFELLIDIPSKCWENLITGKADIGLVPVAKLNSINNYHLISDYCIGCNGSVNSVFLFSQVPLDEIEEVLLDYQSETSVRLTRVLAKYFWKITPKWSDARKGYENRINGKTAGVVIGDRTFDLVDKFDFKYDLGTEWGTFCGMPFVFACWVSFKELPKDFINQFNDALKYGVENLDKLSPNLETNFDVTTYLKKNIDYYLNDEKKGALAKFLNLSKEFT